MSTDGFRCGCTVDGGGAPNRWRRGGDGQGKGVERGWVRHGQRMSDDGRRWAWMGSKGSDGCQ